MYFLADEAIMQAATASAASTSASMTSNSSSSNFGIRSLEASVSDSELRGRRRTPVFKEESRNREEEEEEEEVVEEEDGDDDNEEEEEELESIDAHSMTSFSTATRDFVSAAPSPRTNMSLPLTPVLGPSMAPSPILGSPVTPRSTCGREGDDFLGGAPQLIMPQIIMPSRRPFTDKGKRIGKLKILIAGDSGDFPLLTPYNCTQF
jgi:hypothetical protein